VCAAGAMCAGAMHVVACAYERTWMLYVCVGWGFVRGGVRGCRTAVLHSLRMFACVALCVPPSIPHQDAFAFYYFQRKRFEAAVDACRQASACHVDLGQWDHVAKCRLHTAAALAQQGKHSQAQQYLQQVLGMVDDGRLESGGVTAEKMLLIAVAYHNTAVEHMLALQIEDAAVASQSCLKIAALCGWVLLFVGLPAVHRTNLTHCM
jgi:hypothetical protein